MVRPVPARLWALIAVQLAILPALAFIDYGWQGPGQFGLRIDHQILLGLFYAGLWLTSLVWAIRRNAWQVIAVQTLAPVLLALWVQRPGPTLHAADEQGLIGMTREEVTEALDRRRAYWDSESRSEEDTLGSVLHARGIDLYLADERRITHIVPGEDPVPGSEYPALVAAEHQDLIGKPYRTGYETLLRRGGIDYSVGADERGTYDVFNGVRLYYDGAERVRRVTTPVAGG